MLIAIDIILTALAVVVAAYVLPGVVVDGFLTAIIVAIVLAIVNGFVRPIVFFLTLPLNILTLGLFSFVIIGMMILLVSALVPGFQVGNIGWALLFALIVAIVSSAFKAMAY